MSDQRLWYLEQTELDQILAPELLKKVGVNARFIKYNKGDYIFQPSNDDDKIFFIIVGKVKIGIIRDEVKEMVTSILQKGNVFGELAILEDKNRLDFAQAAENVEICEMSIHELKKLANLFPQFNILMMTLVGAKVANVEQKLESVVFKDSKSRIIEFIVQSVEKSGERIGYEWVVRQFSTHQDIASITSTSRQTVTVVLNNLRQERLLDFDRKRLLVRDLERLKEQLNQKKH